MPPRHLSRFCLAITLAAALSACGSARTRYQGMEAEALFDLATAEREAGDFDDAIAALDRLLLVYGDWPNVPVARLMLADVHFDKREFLTARAEYQRFLDRYQGHPSSPDAALGICRSLSGLAPLPERDQGYTQEAIGACRNVVVDYAGLAQANEAASISNDLRDTIAEKEYNTGHFYFRRKLFDSAIIYYELVANLYAETEWAPLALLGVYQANQAIGYEDLADAARELLLTRYPDSEAAAEIGGDGNGS